MAPLQYVTRLAVALALSGFAAVATYVLGVWVLKQVVSIGLQVVPAG